jgi:splicing factor 3A subunit 1
VSAPPSLQSLEPAAKRPKLDEFGLIPEEDYLANNSGPVSIRVQVQESADKGTWKLNGQTLNVNLDVSETINKLKEKLQAEIEMPPNKMNLKLLTAKDPDSLGFLRDQNTLAYYNINNVSILQLTKKERGRKK